MQFCVATQSYLLHVMQSWPPWLIHTNIDFMHSNIFSVLSCFFSCFFLSNFYLTAPRQILGQIRGHSLSHIWLRVISVVNLRLEGYTEPQSKADGATHPVGFETTTFWYLACVNPFHVTGLFLYPLKRSEKQVFWCFQEV